MKAVAACELDVYAILVSLPFVKGKEGAEGGEAERDGFVGTEGLGVVGVFYCPVEAWGEGAQTGGCVSEVFGVPFYRSVVTTCAAEVVAVGAVVVPGGCCKYEENRRWRVDLPSKRIVPYTVGLFDSKHQRSITCPLQSEEAC